MSLYMSYPVEDILYEPEQATVDNSESSESTAVPRSKPRKARVPKSQKATEIHNKPPEKQGM